MTPKGQSSKSSPPKQAICELCQEASKAVRGGVRATQSRKQALRVDFAAHTGVKSTRNLLHPATKWFRVDFAAHTGVKSTQKPRRKPNARGEERAKRGAKRPSSRRSAVNAGQRRLDRRRRERQPQSPRDPAVNRQRSEGFWRSAGRRSPTIPAKERAPPGRSFEALLRSETQSSR